MVYGWFQLITALNLKSLLKQIIYEFVAFVERCPTSIMVRIDPWHGSDCGSIPQWDIF